MSTDLIVRILKKIPFFEGLDARTLEFFARCATLIKVKKGEMIFREGQTSDKMYIIVQGKVEISRTGKDGQVRILAQLEHPDMLGEMTLLDGKPRSATAIAGEDSILFSLSRQDFQIFLKSNFPVALKIIETLSLRLRTADEQLGQS
ncbi:cyclic nucleotide-binding domain-containing protein [Pelotomaculum isophthalicicum JI]|uniref:Cyclic nucleotide-binding domain-containing protein n=1 Tax=Pelotomaculum isophthalicicum JI TaxID=947010 RepID=A0A9X4JSV9_9FIRM|nr:cyclic nucleotide-binding domain-containing protein [Pelotomaculum isophthalicicum]MDF9407524.1 cyclic nucleotide-binding domain-containing protein [Pelotomaculum isophthalicicum JI]